LIRVRAAAALDRVDLSTARVSPHRPFCVRDVQRAIARFFGKSGVRRAGLGGTGGAGLYDGRARLAARRRP
jgi:hypothetical protein